MRGRGDKSVRLPASLQANRLSWRRRESPLSGVAHGLLLAPLLKKSKSYPPEKPPTAAQCSPLVGLSIRARSDTEVYGLSSGCLKVPSPGRLTAGLIADEALLSKRLWSNRASRPVLQAGEVLGRDNGDGGGS